MPSAQTTALIQEIRTASDARLRQLWHEQIGHLAAPELETALIRPVLAYRIQEKAYGGLSVTVARQLKAVLRESDPTGWETNEASSRLAAGTRIVREWNGKTHEVTITAAGYLYEGQHFQSLSPIACLITGTRWSGPAFFGTRNRDRR